MHAALAFGRVTVIALAIVAAPFVRAAAIAVSSSSPKSERDARRAKVAARAERKQQQTLRGFRPGSPSRMAVG